MTPSERRTTWWQRNGLMIPFTRAGDLDQSASTGGPRWPDIIGADDPADGRVVFVPPAPLRLDVPAGWARLADRITDLVLSGTAGITVGVDIDGVSVLTTAVHGVRSARAVWSGEQWEDPARALKLMSALGWAAVNEDHAAGGWIYGEYAVDAKSGYDAQPIVDAVIELSVLSAVSPGASVVLFRQADDTDLVQVGERQSLAAALPPGTWDWISASDAERQAHNHAFHRAWGAARSVSTETARRIAAGLERALRSDRWTFMNDFAALNPQRPPWLQAGDLYRDLSVQVLIARLGRSVLTGDEFSDEDYFRLTHVWRRFVGPVHSDDHPLLDPPAPGDATNGHD